MLNAFKVTNRGIVTNSTDFVLLSSLLALNRFFAALDTALDTPFLTGMLILQDIFPTNKQTNKSYLNLDFFTRLSGGAYLLI